MKIYKYTLGIKEKQTIPMPADAKILSVQTQHGIPCLWALCHENAELEGRIILVFGTGHTIPGRNEIGAYIGTFQMRCDSLVFHVFEEEKNEQ